MAQKRDRDVDWKRGSGGKNTHTISRIPKAQFSPALPLSTPAPHPPHLSPLFSLSLTLLRHFTAQHTTASANTPTLTTKQTQRKLLRNLFSAMKTM